MRGWRVKEKSKVALHCMIIIYAYASSSMVPASMSKTGQQPFSWSTLFNSPQSYVLTLYFSSLYSKQNCNSEITNFQWDKWVRINVNIINWRANRDRLSTCDALIRRNISISWSSSLKVVRCYKWTGWAYIHSMWFGYERLGKSGHVCLGKMI